jgi:hypothetical protein
MLLYLMKNYITSINAVLHTITTLKHTRRETTVKNWARLSKLGGVEMTEADTKACMRYLEARGCGRYVPGRRHRFECRFQWSGRNIEYIRAALREIDNGAEASAQEPVIGRLILELENIVAKIKAAVSQPSCSSSPATVEAVAGDEALGGSGSLTSSLRLPKEGCFTARDIHTQNAERSLASVRVTLNEMVEQGELDVVEIQSGRVGRPVKLYAWALAKAA